MQRRFFSSVVVAFVVLSFAIPASARRHRKFKGVIIVNQILKLDGTIQNNGVQVPEYSGVKQGDVLETGDNSEAIIRIPGLAIFKLAANTRFRLVSFSDRNESRFEIEKGGVLSLFRRPGNHVVRLAHSTLTLHGTTFFAQSDPSGPKDFVCLCDGKIVAQVKEQAQKESKKQGAIQKTGEFPRDSKRNVAQILTTANPNSGANPPSSSSGPVLWPSSANPTPAPSPYTGPVISAEPDSAVRIPSPTPEPMPKEMEVRSADEHKQFAISEEGIVAKDFKLLDLHTKRETQELQSLYELP